MSQATDLLRLRFLPWPYVGLTVTSAVLNGVLPWILIGPLGWGVPGYFAGTLGGALMIAAPAWWMNRQFVRMGSWAPGMWLTLLRFGLPLVPASMAMVAMNSTDRWFIQAILGPTDLGLYAVAARFAAGMGVVVQAFRLSWWPIAMEAMQTPEGPAVFRQVARLYAGTMAAGVVALSTFAPILVRGFAGPDYFDAWKIVGVLGWQVVLFGFFLIGSAGIWKAERTYLSAVLMLFASALGFGMNWLLVPRFGLQGAAWSTVLVFLIWTATSMFVSERLWQVHWPVWSLVLPLALGLGYSALRTTVLAGAPAVWVGLAGTFVAVICAAVALPRNDWVRLANKIRNRVGL